MEYIQTLLIKINSNVVLKSLAALVIVISEFFVDSVLAKGMLALFFLIIMDWITAIFAARKTKEKITSAKVFRTPLKMAIYFMLISSGRIAEFSLPAAVSYLDDTILAFLALTELISILENTGKIGYAVPKKLLEKLHGWRDDK